MARNFTSPEAISTCSAAVAQTDASMAAAAIQKTPEKYAHYIAAEAGGLIDVKELRMSRILNAPPVPYTRERFNDNYQWTLGWGLVPPGATYENTVDNRAWQ